MSSSIRTPALVLAGWSLFVWATRIRNALADGDLGAGAKTIAVTTAVVFSVGGAAVAFAAFTRHPRLRLILTGLVLVTAVYWPVRLVQIIWRDHSVGFTLVHAALAVISVGLAVWAWPARRARSARPGTRSAGLLPGR
jgi:hypothetical protein